MFVIWVLLKSINLQIPNMAPALVDVPEQLSIAFPLDQPHNQGGLQRGSDKVKTFQVDLCFTISNVDKWNIVLVFLHAD